MRRNVFRIFVLSLTLVFLRKKPCVADALDVAGASSSRVSVASSSSTQQVQVALLQQANESLYTELKSFVCNEQIQRFKGNLTRNSAHRIDSISSKLSFESGTEHYDNILQNDKKRSEMSDLSGAWSQGEYGTLLKQTKDLLAEKASVFGDSTMLSGSRALLIRIDVQESESEWDLVVKSKHYILPYQLCIWVSAQTGQVVRIARTSTSISPETHISQITWSVDLRPTEVNGRLCLLPAAGEYAVSYAEINRREWNVMSFSGYRRYGSEVALRFD